MRGVITIRNRILASLGTGLAIAGVACGGATSLPEDAGAGTTNGTVGSGGTTVGGGGSGDSGTAGVAGSTSAGGSGGTGGGAAGVSGGAGVGGSGGSSDGGSAGVGGSGGTSSGGSAGVGGSGGSSSGVPDGGCAPSDAGVQCNLFGLVCFGTADLIAYANYDLDAGDICGPPLSCPSGSKFNPSTVCGVWMPATSAGVLQGGSCCYTIPREVSGRPFVVEGVARLASVVACAEWASNVDDHDDLAADVRARLAEMWMADAVAEHASIASFARLTLHLLSLGAPPDLVAASQWAALDEIEHARLCFGLASRYGGQSFGPGKLALEGALTNVDFVELAVAAIHEGCVGETLAAALAGERSHRASDAFVRETQAKICDDETRHAELAWRTVVWAIKKGGSAVLGASREAFAAALTPLLRDAGDEEPDPLEEALVTHGWLPQGSVRQVARRVAIEIVIPIAHALLIDVSVPTEVSSVGKAA